MPFSFINVMCSAFYGQKRMRCRDILYLKGATTGLIKGMQLMATPASSGSWLDHDHRQIGRLAGIPALRNPGSQNRFLKPLALSGRGYVVPAPDLEACSHYSQEDY